jgi:hypothetical protein
VPRVQAGLEEERYGRGQQDEPPGYADQLAQQPGGLIEKDRDRADVPAPRASRRSNGEGLTCATRLILLQKEAIALPRGAFKVQVVQRQEP